MTLYLLASLLPLFALAWSVYRRRPSSWHEVGVSALALICLLGGVLYVTHPFLHGTTIGTGEAYNYSLSTADAVSQLRSGYFPVLAGQTEYAFNGRIHPLRTAPYLSYAAGLVDLLTFRRLTFWAIQNLVLALSFLGGALTAYFGLRRIMGENALGAPLLALAYVFCPAVLAAAYSMDLYMTVAALPFVPLVIAGNIRTLAPQPPLSAYLQLSGGLAATWWAHPPVALWLTLSTVFFHLGRTLLGRVSLKEVSLLIGAGGLTAVLSLFVVVSTFSITHFSALGGGRAPEAVLASINQSFAASLQPISPTADQLGDFQWGYAYWGLFGITFLTAALKRNFNALLPCGVAGLLLVVTTPVPGITSAIWSHAPDALISITSQWPMQRLYLIACGWLLFGAAQLWPDLVWDRLPGIVRNFIGLAVLAAIVWTSMQSWRFIKRGEEMQRAREPVSEDLHRSENINLTVTSYSFFQPPPSFMHAVMDPEMELRLLQRGTAEELVNNWAGGPNDQIESQGAFTATANAGDTVTFDPSFILKPHTKYRLNWSFLVPPAIGTLRVVGEHLRREYPLPQSGNVQGFGMLPANQHGMTLWSSSPVGDTVHVELIGFATEIAAPSGRLADFTLTRIDEAQLPLRLISLLPLRVEVTSPAPAYLETPRMFIDGYRAFVSGKEERVIRSPNGQVMIPVPTGRSVVKLKYAGTFWLNAAFWVSFGAWVGLFSLLVLQRFFPARWVYLTSAARSRSPKLFRWRSGVLLIWGMALGAALVYYGFRYMDRAGPIRLRVVLPRGKTKRSHPLLTTGHNGAGTFIYVVYQDPTHIRVGFDAWGKDAGLSDPIEIDYFVDHEFLISAPALYPEGHWKTRNVDRAGLERLRQRVIVLLDGHPVLDQKAYPFASTHSEITVGENRIGGSTTEPTFSGTILGKSRASLQSLAPAARD